MKIQVILYGTLRNGFPNHDPSRGLSMEMPDGSRIADLVERLEIPRTKLGSVSVGDMLADEDTRLSENDCVRIYQPIFGG